MKRSSQCLLLLILPICVLTPLQAYQESYFSLPVRGDTAVPVWVITPEAPVASVVLFSGGSGVLKITPKGIGRTGNFLIRSRFRFAEQGLQVVIVDKPDDRGDLHDARTRAEHADDVGAVIAFTRHRLARPVWLVGTSRGVISAANAAARLDGDSGPDGLVLTASVMRTGNAGQDSLVNVDLGAITAPILLVHHQDDGCYVSPAADMPILAGEFTRASVVELKLVSGGSAPAFNPCKANTFHGFWGIEAQVVKTLADWIKSH
ncbi:MAG: alpha/beta hydrolase [Proteobacteria bacterium]|nr:alpha/beta hydrolase [Pseudomonadota bacterium]